MLTSCFVGEALPARTGQRDLGALNIIDAETPAIAIAEIELREMAVQMHLADVLVSAVHAAFQNRKEALDGVGVRGAANVLILAVLYRLVRREGRSALLKPRKRQTGPSNGS